ncbi:thioesterase superfamily protein [Sodiomyces alkalinus F11]|uniref:Thioesterase superfamily protein n=1 Tax=Sodiomyces alkalinus (strain CBS 110278 / VKM F-3762 / F11) TaxID=1314773 RepID=A0A3N2Q725_SODAK|nr:thioesterase superfamily protein [Sodiomyces alkalinus F11]ROT42550.1 thioesterase superfamily protein [Sodiomyces alkalinus F11]
MAGRLTPLRFVRSVLRSFQKDSGLEPRLLGNNFRVTDASNGIVKFELDIKKEHTNRLQTIHGGTIASLVDLGGSLAVASKGRFATGVSTDLNVTYLSPGGLVGDRMTGTAICEKMGRTLAFTAVSFYNKKGELAARGSHTKYVAKTWENEDFVAPQEYVDPEEK